MLFGILVALMVAVIVLTWFCLSLLSTIEKYENELTSKARKGKKIDVSRK